MKRAPLMIVVVAVLFAGARAARAEESACALGTNPRPYVGLRGGLAMPEGSQGVASLVGIEVGAAVDQGPSLGMHVLFAQNPPHVSFIDGHAEYGYGFVA